jgi:hypothetical protein
MVNAEDEFCSHPGGYGPRGEAEDIGDLFISVQEREIRAAGIDAAFLRREPSIRT